MAKLSSGWIAGLFLLVPALTAGNLWAGQSQPAEAQSSEIEELRRKVDVLAEEVEKLRSGEPEVEVTPDRARALGLGFSAASVYRKTRGVSVAGYGEMLYENFASADEAGRARNQGAQLDSLRAVLYFG